MIYQLKYLLMYCKKCGNKIDDDSIYCNHCGCKQTLNPTNNNDNNSVMDFAYVVKVENTNNKTNDKKNEAKAPEKGGSGCGVALIVLILLSVFIFFLSTTIISINTGDNIAGSIIGEVFDTNIKRDVDYTVTGEEGFTSYYVTVNTLTKIKECNVKLVIYDKNDNIIYSHTEMGENMSKNSPYTFVFEHGLMTGLKGYKVSIEVSGKK